MSPPLVRRSAAAAVQQALYARLSADATLAAVAGVFDHVPETAARPYVVVGEATETPDDTHDSFGAHVACVVHVWSEHQGFTEGNQIAGRVVELVDRQHHALAVAGHRVVMARHQQTQPMRDPDPKVRHVIVRLRITTEQTDEE